MQKKIATALISVFYKDGLENIVKELNRLGVVIYSTGGTQKFIEDMQVPCVAVESLTGYPSILGGRVKTLHPSVFGGILGRRNNETDVQEMNEYKIPQIDLVIVDLYPFEETLQGVNTGNFKGTESEKEKLIIEKIDIGGPSMIRAAAKNFNDVLVVSAKKDYSALEQLLIQQDGETTAEQRKAFAARAFEVVAHYDVAIAKYFNPSEALFFLESVTDPKSMRYGENPHQSGVFYGDLASLFDQLNGKDLSYNNLVDVDAAIQLIAEFTNADPAAKPFTVQEDFQEAVFAIIKHTNVCGVAERASVNEAWQAALAGDPESAFGGVLVCNGTIDKATAEAINDIFFEVLIAPGFDDDALVVLRSKKNRILLRLKNAFVSGQQYKSVLNGVLVQGKDNGNYKEWKEVGGRETTTAEKEDLFFANIIGKHLKSNAIALVKDKQLVGKGCGQTSRVDSLRQSIQKSKQFEFDLEGAALASDAFFPFDDCVKIAHAAGITSFIQPGGSIRDNDSIDYCKKHGLAMVITSLRHFKH